MDGTIIEDLSSACTESCPSAMDNVLREEDPPYILTQL